MAMSELKGYMGSVSFDGRTVVVSKKMRGSTVIPIGQLSSVQLLPAGIGMSGIKFTVAGGVESTRGKPVGSHKDLASDPYALTFRSKHKASFEAFASEVLEALVASSR